MTLEEKIDHVRQSSVFAATLMTAAAFGYVIEVWTVGVTWTEAVDHALATFDKEGTDPWKPQ